LYCYPRWFYCIVFEQINDDDDDDDDDDLCSMVRDFLYFYILADMHDLH